MLLIGVFALVMMLAFPASADPVSVAILGVVSASLAQSAVAVAITTMVLTTLVSMALSFVASALLKPAGKSGGGAGMPDTSLNTKQSVRQPTAPMQVVYGKTKVGGVYADMWVSSGNQLLSAALIIAGHEITGVDEVWLGDQNCVLDANGYIISGRYAGNGTILQYHGTSTQTACSMLTSTSGGRWTTDHRLQGLAYLALQLYWDNTTGNGNPASGTFVVEHRGAKLWQGGLPNVTAVIRGKKIYDPRTGLTAYSNNSALVVADYLCDPVFGLGVDYATGIDETALITAANVCDEMVTLADGTTEARYTTDGYFKVDGSPDAILGKLLGAMHGSAIYDGERWVIKAAAWEEPDAVVLTDDDMRAASTLQTLTSTRDIANGVKGTYVGEETKWQPADFPAIDSATFLAADGGVEKWRDIELPYSSTATRCQRLAKIDLLKQRYETVETFKGKLKCWRYTAGQTIYRTSERYGWTNKAFLVGSVKVVPDQDAEGNPMLGVDLTLYETASSIYSWSTSEETPISTPADASYPDLYDVVEPTVFSAVETTYTTAGGGGVKSKVTLSWVAPVDALVTAGGWYEVQWRVTGATTWNSAPDTLDTSVILLDVAPASYQYRLRAVNYAGNPSDWVTTNLIVSGDSTPPEDVIGFGVTTGVSGYSTFSWNAPTGERARSGTIEIRYSAATSGVTWATTTTLVAVQSGVNTSAILPTKIGSYVAKYKSPNGVYSSGSSNVAVVSTTQTTQVGIEIVSGLPTTDLYEGRIVYLNADDKLYRYSGTAWIAAVAASDINGEIGPSQIAASAITADKIAAGAVTAAKISVADLSAMSADLGNITAGTVTGATFQTASSGTRAVMDTRVMFRAIDASYATRPYYRSVGWSEPNLIAHLGADAGYGYSRLLNYYGTTALDIQAFGNTSSPWTNTPSAIGVASRGTNIGVQAVSEANVGAYGDGYLYDFYAGGAGTNYGPFTGAHDALVDKAHDVAVGDIVVDVELIAQKNVSNAITRVELSSTANQPGALGAVCRRTEVSRNMPPAALAGPAVDGVNYPTIAEEYAGYIATHDRLLVNALGEGLINVCGQGGDIAIGDLIVTSDAPGKGMKQSDNIVRGHTVAKAREPATFATPGEVKTIACIYVSG